jgi:hypothetical protein
MVAIFNSIDRDSFDLILTREDGVAVQTLLDLDLPALLSRLPQLVGTDAQGLNVVIRPIARETLNRPALIRIDDLDPEEAAGICPYAFLTLETAPGNFQCWLAVARSPAHSPAALARQLGLRAIVNDGKCEVRLAGSENVSPEHRRSDGRYPLVKVAEARTGLLNTVRQLEKDGVRSVLTLGRMF